MFGCLCFCHFGKGSFCFVLFWFWGFIISIWAKLHSLNISQCMEQGQQKMGNLSQQISQLKSQVASLKKQVQRSEYGQILESEGIDYEDIHTYIQTYDQNMEEYSQMLKSKQEGPIPDKQRSCTNVACCLFLLVLVGFMLGMAIRAWTGDKFSKLVIGYDAEGNSCGGYYADYPYMYFVAPNYDTLWRTVCVKKCPNETSQILQCIPNKFVPSCEKNPSTDPQISIQIYESFPLGRTLCLPMEEGIQQQIKQAAGQSSFAAKIIILSKIWPLFLCTIPIAVALAVGFMWLIKEASKEVVYVLLGLSVIACPAFGIYMLVTPPTSKSASNFTHILGIALSIGIINFGVIIFIGLCSYRKRIKLICSIVKLSARFIHQNMSIAILPLVLFLVTSMYIVLCIFQALGFYTLGTVSYNEKQLPFQHFIMTWSVTALMVLHGFHVVWMVFFMMDTNQFIISGVVVNWYYEGIEQEKADTNHLLPSLSRYASYHTGSVAMGSFLMALFGLIKFLYTSLMSEQSQQIRLQWTNTIKSFLQTLCCFCTKYVFNCLNTGTYTYINLFGRQYCTSSIDILCLKIREIFCTPIITFLNTVFSILIKVGITALTVLIAYIVLNTKYKNLVHDTTFTLVIVGLISFIIGSFFVSLYSTAMESIYVCFLVDCSDKREARQRSFKMLKKLTKNDYENDQSKPTTSPNKKSTDTNKEAKSQQDPELKALRIKKLKEMMELKKIVHTFHDISEVPGNMNNILQDIIKTNVGGEGDDDDSSDQEGSKGSRQGGK